MTVVTRKFADITKRPDFYQFEFETGLRRSNEDDDVTITPKRIKAQPEDVDGEAVLSVDLDPGPARCWYRGVAHVIEIPETGPVDLQDLIDAGTVEHGAPEIPSNSVALRGYSVDDWDLVGGTDLQFSVRGEPVGTPKPLPSAAWNSVAGKPPVISAGATQAAARSAVGAVTIVEFNGTTWPARPGDSGPVVFVGGIAPGNEPPGFAGDVWIPTVEDGVISATWDAITGKPTDLLTAATVAALPTKTGLASADVLALFDSAASGAAKQVSLTSLLKWVRANEPDVLTAGEGSMARDVATTTATMTSQSMRLRYFTAKKTETITTVRTYTGATAAGATPTLCRVGIFSVNESTGDLTLVASTANDTSLWAATSTAYAKALSTPWSKVAGNRYAAGVLCVTSATAPTLVANSNGSSALAARAPRLTGAVASLSDLPSTVAAGSVGVTAAGIYVEMVP